jgi:hypothetical protein
MLPLQNPYSHKIPHHPSLYFTLSLSPLHLPLSLHSPLHLSHLFISLISSSPQLIVPLISYLNHELEFYFGPFVVLLRFMFQRFNIFLSLLLDWIYLWIQVCIFLLDLWVLNHGLWFCCIWCFFFFSLAFLIGFVCFVSA